MSVSIENLKEHVKQAALKANILAQNGLLTKMLVK